MLTISDSPELWKNRELYTVRVLIVTTLIQNIEHMNKNALVHRSPDYSEKK